MSMITRALTSLDAYQPDEAQAKARNEWDENIMTMLRSLSLTQLELIDRSLKHEKYPVRKDHVDMLQDEIRRRREDDTHPKEAPTMRKFSVTVETIVHHTYEVVVEAADRAGAEAEAWRVIEQSGTAALPEVNYTVQNTSLTECEEVE